MPDPVLERVVAARGPVEIILFGSAAEEEMGFESDLDILVIAGEPPAPCGRDVRGPGMRLEGLQRMYLSMDEVTGTG